MPDYDSFAADFFRRFAGGKRVEVYNPSSEHLERFKSAFGSAVELNEQDFAASPYAQQKVA